MCTTRMKRWNRSYQLDFSEVCWGASHPCSSCGSLVCWFVWFVGLFGCFFLVVRWHPLNLQSWRYVGPPMMPCSDGKKSAEPAAPWQLCTVQGGVWGVWPVLLLMEKSQGQAPQPPGIFVEPLQIMGQTSKLNWLISWILGINSINHLVVAVEVIGFDWWNMDPSKPDR